MIAFRWRDNPPGTDGQVDNAGWLDSPSNAWPGRIFGGLVVPLVLFAAGLYCIITQHGVIVGRGWHEVRGTAAVALGIAALGAAIFFHTHAFWGTVSRLAVVHQLGRIVGALLFIGGLGYVVWSIMWLG